jgi:hypothetical protein
MIELAIFFAGFAVGALAGNWALIRMLLRRD